MDVCTEQATIDQSSAPDHHCHDGRGDNIPNAEPQIGRTGIWNILKK